MRRTTTFVVTLVTVVTCEMNMVIWSEVSAVALGSRADVYNAGAREELRSPTFTDRRFYHSQKKIAPAYKGSEGSGADSEGY
jgi:hypothetical protein